MNKLDDLKSSSTSNTPSHEKHKFDPLKAQSKGEGDKEKGKPAAVSKSVSRQETVMLHHSTVTDSTVSFQLRSVTCICVSFLETSRCFY